MDNISSPSDIRHLPHPAIRSAGVGLFFRRADSGERVLPAGGFPIGHKASAQQEGSPLHGVIPDLQRAGARQLIGAPKQGATVADVGIDCGVGGDIASILKTVRWRFTSLTQTQRALKLATYAIAHGRESPASPATPTAA